ncbi:mRNA-capping enzyme [Spatholobus suberectus]|nr:mRNA-capping enzyme [Spatholobus suberectus]
MLGPALHLYLQNRTAPAPKPRTSTAPATFGPAQHCTQRLFHLVNRSMTALLLLGLVIDLTNTSRYYPVADLKKECIKHVKIQCKGRDSVPDNLSVNQFVYEVTQFLSRQKHSKKYILVHCTHGHNRTGYMIIHYLMRAMSMSVTQRSSEFDLNGEAVPDDDDDGVPGPDLQENHETDARMTNDDVLGDEIPTDQQDALRQFCYQTLKLGVGARGHTQFPGSHPVSLNRDNLQLLRQRYYYATWKADGTRYMMLITMDGCYLIDRSFNFRRVQMRFPCRSTNDGLGEKTHHFTLLDGEMVHLLKRNYRNFAIIAESRSIRPFYERWKMLEKEVIEPRNHERHHIYQSRNPYYRYDLEPFRVRRKDFWLLSTVTKLLKEFIKRLSHEADGLIFQGWDDPYVPRTHEGLLKWKYAYLNSVDFLFEVDGDRELLFLYERGKKKLLEGNKVEFTDGSDPSLYSGKIIECSWDFDKQEWNFLRIRTDKSTPNEFNTYRKVMRSIRDNITEDDLLNEISEIIRLPMYADRIRIDSKANQHANVARRR